MLHALRNTGIISISTPCFTDVVCRQDGVRGAAWVCTVLRGMDLPCYTHTFYERPEARSGLRERCVLQNAAKEESDGCHVAGGKRDELTSKVARLKIYITPTLIGL